VKTSRFVVAKGIDSALLGWHFFDHGVPDYPPLVPVVQGWGSLLAAGLPWTFVPVISALWLVVGAVAVNGLLARRFASGSAATALFWFTALSISAVYSYSGGNAETPLIAFVTVACASLMVERADERWTRAIAAMAFAGALLTKVEALVAWSAVVLGTIARDVWLRRPDVIRRTMIIAIVPLLALGLWFFYQWRAGLPVGYEAHGQLMQLRWSNLGSVLEALPRHLNAGAWGLAWLIPLVVMAVAGRRSWIPALPALTGVAALFAFFVFDYLHDLQPPIERIGWTLPRISQPALSLWILAAAVIASPARNQQAEI
jgi:hypothetical protein